MDKAIELIDGRVLRILSAKNGQPTLMVNDVLIHSRYDPQKEAVAFIDYHKAIYQDKDNIVAYGVGLGYHIHELLKRICPDCKVHLFEVDRSILEIAKSIGVLGELLNDHRVRLIEGYNHQFLNEFAEMLNSVEDILMYKPSMRALPECYEEFKNAILDFEIGRIGLERFGSILNENNELNQKLIYSSIEDFLNNFNSEDKPIVIASSGPSLDSSIKNLIKYRSNYNLFCAGSALRTLMKYQVKPDMICIIDGQDVVAKQFIGYEELNVPLCFLNTASHTALWNYQGPKYIFYNQPKQGNSIIETGKSVATAILSIALKVKVSQIIFVGQDLAFINNKHHTETFSDIYGKSNEISSNDCLETVVGVNGDQLYTNSGLLSFKRWIERAIGSNPQVSFINAGKGAKIKGTIERDLEEIFE